MSTKTAYAKRMTDAELAAASEGLTPEEAEALRIENATNPLFDMWLRFVGVFGDRAIDKLDVSDADADLVAAQMEAGGTESGRAFAYLLRSIGDRRRQRMLHHMVDSVWAAEGDKKSMGIDEIRERYDKLPKGNA